MPSLGADMDAGTVTRWLVATGDTVHRGDLVAEVETDKSTIEVEIFQDGVVDELVVPEGRRVPVGTTLARVIAPGEVRPGARRRTRAGTPPPARRTHRTRAEGSAPGTERTLSPVVRRLAAARGIDLGGLAGTGPGGTVTRADVERAASHDGDGRHRRTRSSPLARRRASELGVDLRAVHGTGPAGAITEADVRQLAAAAPPAAAAPRAQPPSIPAVPPEAPETATPAPAEPTPTPVRPDAGRQATLRKAIGSLMSRSQREIPHYYLSTTVDVTAASLWLERANADRPVTTRLVLAALLLKATARAARRVPEMNGFYVDGEFRPSPAVHVGVAVSLRTGGVLAPAVHDVDMLAVEGVMAQLQEVVDRARHGALRSSEMSDPTITVTNLGDLGVEAVFGVIYPPQVALVGFGRVTERPVALAGMLGVHPCLTVTLSADHRVSDGRRGARFLAEIDRVLQRPEEL